ncbi:hypothetical protein CLOSTMETH_00726 [[Clostridium] methylpentosum DSM 5476]|uniref:Uncharacterized protein n=1 Tax=[Clostridium] methylpentosum DSM 5476 TaxID=537013 RepID=C0EA72_9FIRM|nr:hypothetical protein CLOSTMETH_00726 [[Clostridium] methylpentosum DSM 5476]
MLIDTVFIRIFPTSYLFLYVKTLARRVVPKRRERMSRIEKRPRCMHRGRFLLGFIS